MPVFYDIFPDLNLVIYFCSNAVTPVEFFNIGDKVALDPRFHAQMKIIIDFFSADIETSVSDLYLAVTKNAETKQKGQQIGQTAVLTTSVAMNYLGDTLRFLSLDEITNFGIFHSEKDAINWLELPLTETSQCWAEVREKSRRE